MLVYAIYDSKAEAYMQPMVYKTKGQAIRAFEDAINDKETLFSKHAQDFTLWELGEYDETKGEIIMHEHKQNCSSGWQVLKTEIPNTLKPLELNGTTEVRN